MMIVEFLLARIAETEALAHAAWPDRWEQDSNRNAVQSAETGLRVAYEGLHMGVANCAMTVGNYQAEARNAAHIAAHDPAAVLARCAADRRIVEHCERDVLALSPGDPYVLQIMAQPYADHADFDPAWAVAS